VSSIVAVKLLAIFTVVAVGWVAGRTRLLRGDDAVRTLTNLAFFIFTPALLFRTTARIDLADMPWSIIGVYFGPVVALLLAVYWWQRAHRPANPADPSVRAISTTFGNTVQLGIPLVTALFGEPGLTVHVAIVSLHAVILLTVLTVLVERDLARAAAREEPRGRRVAAVVALTARRAVIHPVVLPVLAGLGWNLVRLPVPRPLDDVLGILAQAVVPVCLVLIGISLARYGVSGIAAGVLARCLGKLVIQPAAVLSAAYWLGGLRGTALSVVVLCAALPIGSNALLFAQRYEALEGETTAGVVASTLAFAGTGIGWLIVVSHLAR
jgi:malonate transporter